MVNIFFTKNRLPTHSECDLFDKFELEFDHMQQKTTECVPLVKVACLEQKNLLNNSKNNFKISPWLQNNYVIVHLEHRIF